MSDAEFYSYVQLRAMMSWSLFHENKTIFLYLFCSKFYVIFLPPNDDVLNSDKRKYFMNNSRV